MISFEEDSDNGRSLDDAIGLEMVNLFTDKNGEERVFHVEPLKMTGREGNNYTFEAELTPTQFGQYKSAVRMYPKTRVCPTVRTSATPNGWSCPASTTNEKRCLPKEWHLFSLNLNLGRSSKECYEKKTARKSPAAIIVFDIGPPPCDDGSLWTVEIRTASHHHHNRDVSERPEKSDGTHED